MTFNLPNGRIIAALCLSVFASAGNGNATQRPNILLIYADDIGYEALNCYGGVDFETPRLNAMAAGGMRCQSRLYQSRLHAVSRQPAHQSLHDTAPSFRGLAGSQRH